MGSIWDSLPVKELPGDGHHKLTQETATLLASFLSHQGRDHQTTRLEDLGDEERFQYIKFAVPFDEIK
ncbi:hypothetical protein chiPu_0030339, partial [Chiloscyllium punctatum]|nr:hypothetical protein [Chiloscyllium punctatum]